MPTKLPKNFACVRIAPVRKWDYGTYGSKGKAGKKTGLAGYLAHDFRFMRTPNADMKLTGTNLIFSRKTKWKALKATHKNLKKIGIKNEFSIPSRAEKILRKLNVQVQKNSIVATALMLTISPEFLRDGDISNKVNDEKLEKYIQGTLKFLRKRFGSRLQLVCLHMDELNPHISAYVLPLMKIEMKATGRPKKGQELAKREIREEIRLSHTKMFTRDKLIYEKTAIKDIEVLKEIIPGECSKLQDEYTDSLQGEGLDVIRGVKAEPGQPRLRYLTAKQQYERMMRGIKDAEEAIERIKDLTREQIEEVLRQSIAVATEADNLRIQRDHYQNLAAVKDGRISSMEKKIADSMRELSVAEVIEAVTGMPPIHLKQTVNPLGRHGSNKGRKINIETEFHLPNGQKIGVDNTRNCFENLTPEIPFLGEGAKRQSGTGSINAVMYLSGCSYDTATSRIAEIFGNGTVQRAVIAKIDHEIDDKKKALTLPDESKWPELFAKLRTMNIDQDVIENAKATSSITVNGEGHMIFSKTKFDDIGNQISSGAVIIDPRFPEVAVMETGEDDAFIMMDSRIDSAGMLTDAKPKYAVICASPMDALAIKARDEHRSATVISIGKNPGDMAKVILQLIGEGYPEPMRFAHNLMEHGRKLHAWLEEHFAQVIQLIPLPETVRSWIGLQTSTNTEVSSEKEVPKVVPVIKDNPSNHNIE